MNDASRYAVPVSGPAAFVLARMLQRDEVETRLDKAGFRGSPRAEAFRVEVLSAVELLAERGQAWHAAQRGDEHPPPFTAAFDERGASQTGRQSRAMFLNSLTQNEAAEALGVTPQRVGQLRKSGELYGWQDERGRWLYDRDEVQTLAEEREARSVA